MNAPHEFRRYYCTHCGDTIDAPVACGNRFCDVCSGPRRARVRWKLNEFWKKFKPARGYRLKFFTLTIPNMTDADEAVTHLLQSFRRFRQSTWWKRRVRGGAIVIELTGETGRWHAHIHGICEGWYMPKRELSREWERFSGGKIVWIVSAYKGKLTSYLAKYLSKTSVPEACQAELNHALKGRRMFQAFGTWHKPMTEIPRYRSVCAGCGNAHWHWEGSTTFVMDPSAYRKQLAGARASPVTLPAEPPVETPVAPF